MEESIGAFLKRQREMRKVRLEEVAEQTRIRPRYLKALEEEDWDQLPRPVFIKGFVRAYAKTIGLNSEEVTLQLEAHFKTLQESGKMQAPVSRKWLRLSRRPAPWVYFLVLLGVIGIAVWLSSR